MPAMAQAPKRVILVEAVPTEIRAVEEEVKAVGSLKANEAVVIRPEIAGRVVALPFEEGAPVEKNSPLVRLDATAYQAELVQAESALNLSRRNFDRVQELVQKRRPRRGPVTRRKPSWIMIAPPSIWRVSVSTKPKFGRRFPGWLVCARSAWVPM